MREIEVIAGINSKFGELWNISPRNLAREVVDAALKQAGIVKSDIQAVYVANMLSGCLGGQDHLGAFFAEELGMSCSAVRVEGACASGGLAMHSGVLAVSSGFYDTVLVFGLEKMTDHKPEEVAKALMGAGSDSEREAGATFPALYAMMARAHMQKYGTTKEQMAAVAVKNHYHASLNSHAQFRNKITIEKVLKSPVISSPLTLLDCSPITDGASAVILRAVNPSNLNLSTFAPFGVSDLTANRSKRSIKDNGKKSGVKVKVAASVVATDALGLSERADLTTIKSAKEAAGKAYKMAGIQPSDIDVAEVHDCFTIAEIIAMEDLGFFKKGEAAKAIFADKTKLGSKDGPVVNTSGGLKAAGHPVGATGIKQVVEIYNQLMGMAGEKQVKGAKTGLTHNVGGSGATAVIHILKAE